MMNGLLELWTQKTGQGLIVFDHDRNIIDANARAFTLLRANELIGESLTHFSSSHPLPPGPLDTVQFQSPDGRPVWVRGEVTALGQGLSCLALSEVQVGLDRETALEWKDYAHDIVSHAPIPIVCTSSNGKVVMWNQAATILLGWEEKEVVGQESPSIPPEQYPQALDFYNRMRSGAAIYGEPARRQKKDGTPINLKIWAFPLFDRANRLTQIVALLQDMSLEAETESRLRKEKEYAELMSKEKTEFVANVSHELRTPISVILGFCKILQSKAGDPNLRETALTTIERNGKRLLRLVDSILDLSKIEIGEVEIQEDEVKLDDFLQDVIDNLKPKADAKKLSLTLELDEGLPSVIYTDGDRVRQILFNLIDNAFKFTERGGVTVRCGLTKSVIPKLRMVVCDTGPGIGPQAQTRLFQVFSQGDSSISRRYGGSGLGLALSQRLARRLGGNLILLRTGADKGSQFELTIDMQLRKVVPGKKAASKPLALVTNLKGLRLLVAEDNHDNRFLLTHCLQELGAQVSLAEDGLAAVKLMEKEAFDAILMDIQMPNMDGIQAMTELRQRGHRLPIIALTAHAMSYEKQNCLAAGFDAYLTKPIILPLLSKTIRSQITAFKRAG